MPLQTPGNTELEHVRSTLSKIEAPNVLVSVETEEAWIAASFLLVTFGLSEEMEVGSEDVEGIFSSLCCLIFLSKAHVSSNDVHVMIRRRKLIVVYCFQVQYQASPSL